jgi:hypothetical protein
MKKAEMTKRTPRTLRSRLSSLLVVASASVALIGGFTAGSSALASATALPHAATGPCNVTVSAGTGVVVGTLIAGVSAGTTKVTFDCNISSTPADNPAFVAETALLAAIDTSAVNQQTEADSNAVSSFTASANDTNCPAAAAGDCTLATFTIPTAFAASDSQAACPPTQTQINEGLFGCDIAVASAQLTGIAGAEYLLTYATQATPPNAPTIAAAPSGVPGSTIKVSDASGNTGYWWANAIQQSQALALSTTPQAPPSTCASTGGYGNVPTPFLEVNWFVAGTTIAIPGSAAGVTISNDCYDGTTLHAPVLGGAITVPSSLKLGTAYKAYLCELNFTPYPSNDANATGDCGPAPAGETWIDASFNFTAALGPITQVAPTSGVQALGAASSTQLNVTGNNGAVSFVQSSTPVTGVSVSPTGLVSGASTLAAGTYPISGTDSDVSGDSGTWSYTLSVGTAQAALTLTSLKGTVGSPLPLATSGGSGTGAVTYTVTNGTASGCSVSGSSLSATSAGTCIVTATKAGDSTYVSASSVATTVLLGAGNGLAHVSTKRAAISDNQKGLLIHFTCGALACRDTATVTAVVAGRLRASSSAVTRAKILIGRVAVRLAANSSKSLTIAITGAAHVYFMLNPSRPSFTALVSVSGGSSHLYIGHVTIVK